MVSFSLHAPIRTSYIVTVTLHVCILILYEKYKTNKLTQEDNHLHVDWSDKVYRISHLRVYITGTHIFTACMFSGFQVPALVLVAALIITAITYFELRRRFDVRLQHSLTHMIQGTPTHIIL